MTHTKYLVLAFLVLLATVPAAFCANRQDFDNKIVSLRNEWADIKYNTPDISLKKNKLKQLKNDASNFAQAYPDAAEPLIWQAVALATDAEITKSMADMPKLKEAKMLLENAIQINPKALNGAAYLTLGALYQQLPPWPLAFGSNKKAKENFEAALAFDPDGMDSNFFCGNYLIDRGQYAQAIAVLNHALAAKPRDGFEIIERERRKEIQAALDRAQRKIGFR